MTERKSPSDLVGARIKSGDLTDLIDPLDYKLMEDMPIEGTNMGGLYQIGTTVKELSKKFGIASGLLSGRVRMMNSGGLVTSINMIGSRGSRAWQRTAAGEEVLKTWQAKQS